jgi:hypothetical protein
MKISVKTEISDIVYKAVYDKPAYDLLTDQDRLHVAKIFVESYGLRLNDIKFDSNNISDRFIHFTKFDNPSFFDVDFGFEELTATLRRVRTKTQAKQLFEKLNEILNKISFASQYWNIHRQLSTSGDAREYLKSLNPKCPKNFKPILETNGVYYTLKLPKNSLMARVTLVDSQIVPEGLYLNIFSVPINSLNNKKLEIKKPIDVIIEQRGREEFIACLYDAELYGYGESIPEALEDLKEAVVDQFSYINKQESEIKLGRLPQKQLEFLNSIIATNA